VVKYLEPKAPTPRARANALATLSSEGIETWIFLGPVIPGVNDDEDTLEDILRLARETKSKVLIDSIHIRPWLIESLRNSLTNVIASDRHVDLILSSKSYIKSWWSAFKEKAISMCKKFRVKCYPQFYEPQTSYSKTLLDYM